MTSNIRDVARLAGVSPRTVSNVVNDYVHVKPETRARVQTAIKELNYRPNLSARRLRQGRTNILGFAVPELSQPYFAELSELIERSAQRHGYTVMARQTGGTLAGELRALRDFTSHMVDGLVFSPMTMVADDLVATPPEVPTILIGEQISHSQWPSVAIDNLAAAKEVTRHLLDQGNRRIATLGAYHDTGYRSSALRLLGFREAMAEAGVGVDEALMIYTDEFSRQAGRDGVARALASDLTFDAIFCFTDLLAFGALRALADAGLRAPHDVAIASIDDIEEAAYSVPSLTTIAPDKDAIAHRAVDSLLDLIADAGEPAGQDDVPYQLIVRESSRPRLKEPRPSPDRW